MDSRDERITWSSTMSSGSLLLDLTLGISLILLVGMVLKPILLNVAPPKVEFRDANLDDFPALDRKSWEDYSAKLRKMGFVQLRDATTSVAVASGVFRVFLHPKTNCYGNVHQTFATGAPPLGLSFSSFLGEDWSVGHTTTVLIPGQPITRTGRTIGFSRPGMSADQLYQLHLAMRERIAAGLGMAVVTLKGFETYQTRTDAAQRANLILILLQPMWAKIRPIPNDWWGDFPNEYEARTLQEFVPGEV
jgi:hypothetical protein